MLVTQECAECGDIEDLNMMVFAECCHRYVCLLCIDDHYERYQYKGTNNVER